jgi:hypothetical protein
MRRIGRLAGVTFSSAFSTTFVFCTLDAVAFLTLAGFSAEVDDNNNEVEEE